MRNGLTLAELRHKCSPWQFTKFWWVTLDSVLRSSYPLATFKRRVLKKIHKIHRKATVLEVFFPFHSFFSKGNSSRGNFLRIFQNLWQYLFLKNSSGLLLLWYSILSHQTKPFSKLAKKQPAFWCLYYDIWTWCLCIWLEE